MGGCSSPASKHKSSQSARKPARQPSTQQGSKQHAKHMCMHALTPTSCCCIRLLLPAAISVLLTLVHVYTPVVSGIASLAVCHCPTGRGACPAPAEAGTIPTSAAAACGAQKAVLQLTQLLNSHRTHLTAAQLLLQMLQVWPPGAASSCRLRCAVVGEFWRQTARLSSRFLARACFASTAAAAVASSSAACATWMLSSN